MIKNYIKIDYSFVDTEIYLYRDKLPGETNIKEYLFLEIKDDYINFLKRPETYLLHYGVLDGFDSDIAFNINNIELIASDKILFKDGTIAGLYPWDDYSSYNGLDKDLALGLNIILNKLKYTNKELYDKNILYLTLNYNKFKIYDFKDLQLIDRTAQDYKNTTIKAYKLLDERGINGELL